MFLCSASRAAERSSSHLRSESNADSDSAREGAGGAQWFHPALPVAQSRFRRPQPPRTSLLYPRPAPPGLPHTPRPQPVMGPMPVGPVPSPPGISCPLLVVATLLNFQVMGGTLPDEGRAAVLAPCVKTGHALLVRESLAALRADTETTRSHAAAPSAAAARTASAAGSGSPSAATSLSSHFVLPGASSVNRGRARHNHSRHGRAHNRGSRGRGTAHR